MKIFNTLLESIYQNKLVSSASIVRILEKDSEENLNAIFKYADKIKKLQLGEDIILRGIIEIGNVCDNGCFYCGLRKENKLIERYRLTEREIMKSAEEIKAAGINTVILQSGEEKYFNYKKISSIIKKIKNKHDITITLSLGEAGYDILKEWRECGADRYFLKIETTKKELFERIKPGKKLQKRLKCIDNLFRLGYEVGSGNIVGLPGQTIKDLAEDLIYFREKEFDMISISPLIIHPNTPFINVKKTNYRMSLKVLALARIITKNSNIPATTALETLDGNLRKKALKSGANVVMISFTPLKYKSKYEIYPDRCGGDKSAEYSIRKIAGIIKMK
ncbi:MAG: [FeFe] hydrogenase H-cluster radical SAM maturase HydE [Candidatus Firestonebacteria bacterium]